MHLTVSHRTMLPNGGFNQNLDFPWSSNLNETVKGNANNGSLPSSSNFTLSHYAASSAATETPKRRRFIQHAFPNPTSPMASEAPTLSPTQPSEYETTTSNATHLPQSNLTRGAPYQASETFQFDRVNAIRGAPQMNPHYMPAYSPSSFSHPSRPSNGSGNSIDVASGSLGSVGSDNSGYMNFNDHSGLSSITPRIVTMRNANSAISSGGSGISAGGTGMSGMFTPNPNTGSRFYVSFDYRYLNMKS